MTRDEIINLYKEKMESNAMSLRDVAKKQMYRIRIYTKYQQKNYL